MRIEQKVAALKKQPVSMEVRKRLESFQQLNGKGNQAWFSELCFCILTANSKAATAMAVQKEAGQEGFLQWPKSRLAEAIKGNKHRFHNTKARYIVEARKFRDIKSRLAGKGEFEARDWLAQNVKGLGYKEASHFLRNVGHRNLAIVDRHILRAMKEHGLIEAYPDVLGKESYEKCEKLLGELCRKTGSCQAELDLYLWYLETGHVLK